MVVPPFPEGEPVYDRTSLLASQITPLSSEGREKCLLISLQSTMLAHATEKITLEIRACVPPSTSIGCGACPYSPLYLVHGVCFVSLAHEYRRQDT